MSRSNGFAAAGDHLVDGAALGKLRVEFPAEFTRPAGACVEAIDDGGVNVFHEERLLGEARTDSPVCEAESHYSASDGSSTVWATPLYYKARDLTSPLWRAQISCFRDGSSDGKSGNPGCDKLRRGAVISGMIRPHFLFWRTSFWRTLLEIVRITLLPTAAPCFFSTSTIRCSTTIAWRRI